MKAKRKCNDVTYCGGIITKCLMLRRMGTSVRGVGCTGEGERMPGLLFSRYLHQRSVNEILMTRSITGRCSSPALQRRRVGEAVGFAAAVCVMSGRRMRKTTRFAVLISGLKNEISHALGNHLSSGAQSEKSSFLM